MEINENTVDLLTLGIARLVDVADRLEAEMEDIKKTHARLERKLDNVLHNQGRIAIVNNISGMRYAGD